MSKCMTKFFYIMQNPDANKANRPIGTRNPIEHVKSWFLFVHPNKT